MNKLLLAIAVNSAFASPMNAATETGGAAAGGTAPKKPKTEITKVKMSDGREVEFPGKRKLLKATVLDSAKVVADANTVTLENGAVTVRLDFRNGETRSFVVPAGLIATAVGHGIEQKLGDETAGEEDVDDMVLSVDSLIERLSSGNPDNWTMTREGGGFSGTSILLKALVELSKKPGEEDAAAIERVKGFLKDKSQAEKMALRTSPKVKPIVDRLEAEKASKAQNVDTGALLAQLG